MVINNLWMFVVLILLLGLSAFFSGSETALMAISRLRLRHLAETKPRRARRVEKVLHRPERLIGAILLGNNLVNVVMTALATSLAISLWGERGIVYVTVVLTLTILIFAEITPKVYAKAFNENVSLITAPILNIIMMILNPMVFLITYISKKLLLIVGVDMDQSERPLMTEAEILTCIKMGWDEGAITNAERKMLSRVFTLNDKSVDQVMVPKDEMVIIDSDSELGEIVQAVLDTGHSRFPIRSRDKLGIAGFIHAKDLFRIINKTGPDSINEIIRPAYFVSEDKMIDSLLRGFQSRKLHQAIVLDAEERVVGLITLEDVLEQLVGSIQDEHDEREQSE